VTTERERRDGGDRVYLGLLYAAQGWCEGWLFVDIEWREER
jgi:hypothetical protein